MHINPVLLEKGTKITNPDSLWKLSLVQKQQQSLFGC